MHLKKWTLSLRTNGPRGLGKRTLSRSKKRERPIAYTARDCGWFQVQAAAEAVSHTTKPTGVDDQDKFSQENAMDEATPGTSRRKG